MIATPTEPARHDRITDDVDREANASLPEGERGSVLVLAKDLRVCNQLRSVIEHGECELRGRVGRDVS